MQAVYIIMPRVHGSGSRAYCQSFRGVLLYHAAGLIAYQEAGLHHHAAGFIAYQEAGTWFR